MVRIFSRSLSTSISPRIWSSFVHGNATRRMCTASSSAAPNNASQDTETQDLLEELAGMIVCPVSKGALRLDRSKNEFFCEASGLAYPVINGIPHLLPSAARKASSS
jgi:uncharacterized protein YbaR (Trm112 family)